MLKIKSVRGFNLERRSVDRDLETKLEEHGSKENCRARHRKLAIAKVVGEAIRAGEQVGEAAAVVRAEVV